MQRHPIVLAESYARATADDRSGGVRIDPSHLCKLRPSLTRVECTMLRVTDRSYRGGRFQFDARRKNCGTHGTFRKPGTNLRDSLGRRRKATPGRRLKDVLCRPMHRTTSLFLATESRSRFQPSRKS